MADVKEQLRAYFDEVDPPFDPSDLMNDPRTVPASRPGVGRGVLVAGVAAMVLVLAVGLPLLFLANRPPTAVEPSATTTEAPITTTEPVTSTSATTTAAPDRVVVGPPEAPADVFSWDRDDMSDWVTEDEITAVLADLSIEYAGTPLDGKAEFEHRGASDELTWTDVLWIVGPTDGDNHWQVSVHNGDHLPDDLWLHETEWTLPQGEITTGGWGVFTVRGPNSDESFCIHLEAAPTKVFGTYVREDIYVEMVSAVASMMLEELGWVD